MPRPLIVLLVFCLCSANLYGQEGKAPLPAVKRILDKAVADVKKNRKEFDEANQKPLGDARVELQDLSTKLIKEGKTVDATAVLKQSETLDVDVMKMANAPEAIAVAGKPVPQKPLIERLVGKWTHPNSKNTISFQADGRTLDVLKSNGKATNGLSRPVSPEEAEIKWDSGWTNQIHFIDADTFALRAYSCEGTEHDTGSIWIRVK